MKKLTASLKWLDNNLMKVLTVLFIYLIPLYPKFPLQMLRDTYISIRLDDIFVASYVVIFAIQLIRKKVQLNASFLPLFILYWIAIFLSFALGFYVQHSFIFQYVGFLNAARRVEYMIIFFIAASTVQSKEDFYFYIRHIIITAALVFLYGFGQKFIGLPAIQTMNKEFAKGTTLFLTSDARVSSTFAGHYDLAAYLVMLVPMILAFHMIKKEHFAFITYIMAVSILVMTASRSSFAAYFLSTIAFLIVVRRWWYLLAAIIITTVFMMTSNALTERFAQTFRVKQLFVNEATGQVVLPQNISTSELPAGTSFVKVNGNKASDKDKASSEALLREQFLSQIRLEASRSGKILTREQEDKMVNNMFGRFTPVVGVTADISFATRLQVEWPRAIAAYKRNPLLGSGPSSITESSDNSFIRWLGEFGLLGSSLMIAILLAIVVRVSRALKYIEKHDRLIMQGFIFGMIALAINGTYIDVYEASKVAYTLWLIAGLYIGALPYFTTKKILI
jgi:hypothetical protein